MKKSSLEEILPRKLLSTKSEEPLPETVRPASTYTPKKR